MTFPDNAPTTEAPAQDQNAGTGNEPPWAAYLNDLPESVRPLVEPKFKEWDSSVTQRFQKVHSDYEPLKSYQPLVDNGYGFDDVAQAIQIAQLLNEDPQRVYQALQQQLGVSEQGQQNQGASNPADPYGFNEETKPQPNPEFEQYRQMTEQMAQIMTAQHEAQQAAQEDQQLEAHLTNLKSQHGDFDEDYVLAKVHAGASWEQAVQAYQALGQRFAPAPNAPVVMGSGGGLPSNAVNPATMNEKERKALITQILANAAQT